VAEAQDYKAGVQEQDPKLDEHTRKKYAAYARMDAARARGYRPREGFEVGRKKRKTRSRFDTPIRARDVCTCARGDFDEPD
jgi:hypothetical protein